MEHISYSKSIVLLITTLLVFSVFLSSVCSSIERAIDTITYDVYFGTSSPPPKVVSNQSNTDYDPPGVLEYNTTYYWQIVAWDDQGHSATGPVWHFTTEEVNQPPVAVANGPAVWDKKVSVVFDGSESYDPDGVIVNWTWDFGDSHHGFGEVVQHSYQNSGEYLVTLVVEDDDGAMDDDSVSIEIMNHAPVAIIEGPSFGYVGEPLTFDGSGSCDPDGDSLTYEWDFDDGAPPEYGEIVEHVFTFPGIFIASLLVEDDDLNDPQMDMDTLEVEIIEPNMPPVADAGPDQWVQIFDVVFAFLGLITAYKVGSGAAGE